MKLYLSVFGLCVRECLPAFPLLLVLTGLAEGAGFLLLGHLTSGPFSGGGGTLYWAVFLLSCIALTCGLCTNFGHGESKDFYTLRRLRVSERGVFLWRAAADAVMLTVLLLWQTTLAFLFQYLSFRAGAGAQGAQGMLAEFYRSPFLHSLLPLDERSIFIRNVILVLCFGVTCSYLRLLRGKALSKRRSAIPLSMLLIFLFTRALLKVGEGGTIGVLYSFDAGSFTIALLTVGCLTANGGGRCFHDAQDEPE